MQRETEQRSDDGQIRVIGAADDRIAGTVEIKREQSAAGCEHAIDLANRQIEVGHVA